MNKLKARSSFKNKNTGQKAFDFLAGIFIYSSGKARNPLL